MASNRPESQKEGEPSKASAAEASSATAAAPAAGGFMQWLPLVINVVLMPVLAYGMTTFILLPKTKPASHAAAAESKGAAKAEGGGHGATPEGAAPGAAGKASKYVVPLSGKVLVNIAGTMGTRYLLANLTLVSAQSGLKEMLEKNDAELRDVAAGVLSTKTIADLEKPGARNLIRTELISVFNNVLGDGVVTELYLTEFAIQ